LKENINSDVITAVVSFFFFLLLIFFFVVVMAIRYRKRKKENAQLQVMFQQELLKTQMEIQEQTFKTISQEIHDNIGQMLSLAKMNLSKFEIDREHSDEAVLSAKHLVSQAVSSLRDLSKTLNTDTIATIGLLKSIELELQLVEKTAGIKTAIEINGIPQKMEPQKELILFRIIQESLHNSIKHASPKLLYVYAIFEDSTLQLSIGDNGAGFTYSDNNEHGSGLRNMQSRSKLIGAGWQIESSPGNGTKIHLTIPIQPQHDNNSIS
jgi:signal transduction histidine kinase